MSESDEARLLALYEMVESLAEQTKVVVTQAESTVRSTKSEMTHSASSTTRSIKEAIATLDEKVEAVLAPQLENTRKEQAWLVADAKRVIRNYALWAAGGVCVFFGVIAGLTWHYYNGEYGAYKTYWDKERASGFGFKVVSNENGEFVVFDKEFTLGRCNQPNCFSVKRK